MPLDASHLIIGSRLAACALALAPACTSGSIGSDLTRVRELSAAPVLPEVAAQGRHGREQDDADALLRAPLDADAAVRVALLRNRELRAQLAELGVARGALVQAGAVDNPRASAEALVEEPVEVELRVEYDVTSLLLAPLRADAAEAELAAERYRAAAAVVRLGYEVRAALCAVQAAEQRLAIGRQALEAYAAGRDAMAALHAAGNVRALDAVSQEAAYERARARFAELELELVERRERLQRALGIDAAAAVVRVAAGPAELPETAALPARVEERAVQASLDLGETRLRADAAGLRADAERSEGWVPDVELGVLSQYDQRTDEVDFGDDAAWRWGGGVTVTVPLFDRRRGATLAHESRQAQLVDRHAAGVNDVRSRARELRARLLSVHGRARQYQTAVLPAHARVVEQTLLQYNAMHASVFELLAARRDQIEVELAYVEALREYWTVAAALDALLAGVRVTSAAAGGSAVTAVDVTEMESPAGEH
jgi:outer membrane protein TolC